MQSSALSHCLMWAVLALSGINGTQTDQFLGGKTAGEIEIGVVVLAKFGLGL